MPVERAKTLLFTAGGSGVRKYPASVERLFVHPSTKNVVE
jgi:hypothetical protein